MAEDNTENRPRIQAAAASAAVPRPFGLPLSIEWPEFGLSATLRRLLIREVEQRRLFVFLPVCFGLGVVLFFQAEGEPALWAPVTGCGLFAALGIALRARLAPMAALFGVAAVFAGFAAGAIRTRSVAAPVLIRTVIAPFAGFIEAIEDRPTGARLTIAVTILDRVAPPERPRRIRVTVRDASGLAPGLHVTGQARLLPPPRPAWPGGYDFARDAFFREIGAVGSVLGALARSEPPAPPAWRLQVAAATDAARNALTQRIAGAIGGQAGAVAAALVTGKRGLIDEPTNDVLRGAGIYHIVSISGLHMVLAAGTFFWLARALLALSPAAALLWPVKKIAASLAMLGATAYCIFSGSEVATERSLIMTLVMLGAILADRPAISIRNLSLAALIVLAREPESLLGPSFQMSFGAVAALTALAPLLRRPAMEGVPIPILERGLRTVMRSALGLVLMTLVASLATAPFSAYHFQTLNPLGLIGNALALPLVSLVVMPAAVLGVLAYPFGLDGVIWHLMGLAVGTVLDVSGWVSGLDGATLLVPAIGTGAFLLVSLALLVATLPATALRWAAILPAGAGLALAATPVRYDAFVDREGLGAAIRGREGRLVLVGKPSAFVVEQWLRADGDSRSVDDGGLRAGARCDSAGCIVERSDGRYVAYVQDIRAFEEDCRRATLVVTRLQAPATCLAFLVLDRVALKERGAATIRFESDGILIESAGDGHPSRRLTERIAPRGPANQETRKDRPRPARPSVDLPDLDDEPSSDGPD